jgi:hypothetical protein
VPFGRQSNAGGHSRGMSPTRIMLLDDLVAGLDAAHDVILNYLYETDNYDQRVDDAIAAVMAAADYLNDLRYTNGEVK